MPKGFMNQEQENKLIAVVEKLATALNNQAEQLEIIGKCLAGTREEDTLTNALRLAGKDIAEALREGLGEIATAIISTSEQ